MVVALAASLTFSSASHILEAEIRYLATTIILDAGTFQGTDIRGVSRFLGIPYALPPSVCCSLHHAWICCLTLIHYSTGLQRFSLPLANAPYAGTHDATKYGPSCPGQAGSRDLYEGLSDALNFLKDADFGESNSAIEDCGRPFTINNIRPLTRLDFAQVCR